MSLTAEIVEVERIRAVELTARQNQKIKEVFLLLGLEVLKDHGLD